MGHKPEHGCRCRIETGDLLIGADRRAIGEVGVGCRGGRGERGDQGESGQGEAHGKGLHVEDKNWSVGYRSHNWEQTPL